MKTGAGQFGFTLIEVIMAVAIFSLLMLAMNALFISLYRQQGTDTAMTKRTQSMNYALGTMSRELRGSNRGEDGSFFIAEAGNNSLTFYSDINKDGLTEKISYTLDGTDFKKTITEPGSSSLYAGAGVSSVVCPEIQNGGTPIFTYYNKSYTGSEAPMPVPAKALDISMIGVSLTVNTVSRNKSYPLHAETKIQLRNSN